MIKRTTLWLSEDAYTGPGCEGIWADYVLWWDRPTLVKGKWKRQRGCRPRIVSFSAFPFEKLAFFSVQPGTCAEVYVGFDRAESFTGLKVIA